MAVSANNNGTTINKVALPNGNNVGNNAGALFKRCHIIAATIDSATAADSATIIDIAAFAHIVTPYRQHVITRHTLLHDAVMMPRCCICRHFSAFHAGCCFMPFIDLRHYDITPLFTLMMLHTRYADAALMSFRFTLSRYASRAYFRHLR